ncbi:exo-beta-N-acetylmuramidase NamZ domain-containing protein [Natranaerobius thermophilus]|uniref:Copper amine oxidase domain protein n=1 Tax=Natranaerobius thermophilus (strain ATCC BAA-1301 / DSM 18059 / JW/NM-WN-LF) TaxID=457570 RepID=B2A765_NATTJ|nr:exo-beta-N-acetylmuramidase NamZ domain-containing protein [Natranaerobius thermophilus]ACB84259.1 conserved hypothetical protein [Natranaerobius thermophilus JW/NM-WN-LF]
MSSLASLRREILLLFVLAATIAIISASLGNFTNTTFAREKENMVELGNEVLLDDYLHLVEDKRVGLITNHTGVNSNKESLVDVFMDDDGINLTAVYAPEHGLDGEASAGEYVESYTHEEHDIPVFSLYGQTREPTREMLSKVDVLLFDIQDIGARSYTYISTLNYSMMASEKYDVPVIVLDRPNPLGGMTVEGPVMEEEFISFVGVDKLPKAHGMTVGELAQFFNRKIDVDLTVIPMKNYQRNMIFQDTGLPWVQTSPNIPDLDSCFGYMATGLGEGTGVYQADKFEWIGGKDLDSYKFAEALNQAGLEGVSFIPEDRGSAGGVRLNITDYYAFNPAKTGIYALSQAFKIGDFEVPTSDQGNIVMFDKIMGTDQIGIGLKKELSPQEIEEKYAPELRNFKATRKQYLLDEYQPGILVKVNESIISFDVKPYIDDNNRVLVPLRNISEALGTFVQWEGDHQDVIINKPGGKQIRFTIGSQIAQVNGKDKSMDTEPLIKDGRTMIPARYIGEFLEAQVDWDGQWQRVTIKY